jgi:hypothetical protein
MTFSIMAEFLLSVITLNVTYKPFVLSVVRLSVIRLNVIMLSVVAPYSHHFNFFVAYEWAQ